MAADTLRRVPTLLRVSLGRGASVADALRAVRDDAGRSRWSGAGRAAGRSWVGARAHGRGRGGARRARPGAAARAARRRSAAAGSAISASGSARRSRRSPHLRRGRARCRPASLGYYDHVLRLDPDGEWWFEALPGRDLGARQRELRARLRRARRAAAAPAGRPAPAGRRGGPPPRGGRRVRGADRGRRAGPGPPLACGSKRAPARRSAAEALLGAAAVAAERPRRRARRVPRPDRTGAALLSAALAGLASPVRAAATRPGLAADPAGAGPRCGAARRARSPARRRSRR